MAIFNEEKNKSLVNNAEINNKGETNIKGIKKTFNEIRYDKVVNNVLGFFKKENKQRTISTSSALPTHIEQQNLTSRIFKDLYPNKKLILNNILKKINILNLIYLRFLNEDDLEDVFDLHKELFPVNYHADFYFSICNFDEQKMTNEEIRRANEKVESLINSRNISKEFDYVKKKMSLKTEEKKANIQQEQTEVNQVTSSSTVTKNSTIYTNTSRYAKKCINTNNNDTKYAVNPKNVQNIKEDMDDINHTNDIASKSNSRQSHEEKVTLNKKWKNDQIFSVGIFLPFSFIDYINSEHLNEMAKENDLEKLTEKDILLNYLKFILNKNPDKVQSSYVNNENTTKKKGTVNYKLIMENTDQEKENGEMMKSVENITVCDMKKYIEYKMDTTNEKKQRINKRVNDDIYNDNRKNEEKQKQEESGENIKEEKRRDYLVGSISVLINYDENKRHKDYQNISNFFINKYNMIPREKNCFKHVYDSSKQFFENYFSNDNTEKTKVSKGWKNEKETNTKKYYERKELYDVENETKKEINSLRINHENYNMDFFYKKKLWHIHRDKKEEKVKDSYDDDDDNTDASNDTYDCNGIFYKNIMFKKKYVFDNLMISKKKYINTSFNFEKKIFEEIYMNKNIKEVTRKYVKKKITSVYILTVGTHEYFRGFNLASFLIEYTIFYFYFVIYKLFLFSKKMYCYVDNQAFYSMAYNLKDTQIDKFEESVISDGETDMGYPENDIFNNLKKKTFVACNEMEENIHNKSHHNEISRNMKIINAEENNMTNEQHIKNNLLNNTMTFYNANMLTQNDNSIMNNTIASENYKLLITDKTEKKKKKNGDAKKNYSVCNSVIKHCYKEIVANDDLYNLYDIIHEEHFKNRKLERSYRNNTFHVFNFYELNSPLRGINLYCKILHFFFNNFSIHTLKNKQFFPTQNICKNIQKQEKEISQLPIYMYLHVIEYNKAAINLYNKLNFYYICTYDNFYDINKMTFSSFLYAYFF